MTVASISAVTSPRRAQVLAALPLLLLATACGGSSSGSSAGSASSASPSASAIASAAPAGTCSYAKSSQPVARKASLPAQGKPGGLPASLTIATNRGDVKIALDADKAPCTVNSFVSLAKQGYFDKTTCHRLVTQGLSILQCGDPSASGSGGPGYTFPDELIPDDPRVEPCQDDPSSGQVCTYGGGTVAMANAGPDTNGSQFFLVYADSPLPNSYTVFGRMNAAGVKVVQDVAKAGNAADGVAPKTSVTIESVE
ncbi:MAG: peptidylprolyl isomerase [Marmoricola sp.]|nr:peptidylprolyl isomerase [Marmoricola sp.]